MACQNPSYGRHTAIPNAFHRSRRNILLGRPVRSKPNRMTPLAFNPVSPPVHADDTNLPLRLFAAAARDASANRGREFPSHKEVQLVIGRRSGEMRHTAMARELGVHPRTIRRQFCRGGLPGAKEHGERILVVPTHLFRLAQAYGLRSVERMARAGMLSRNG